MNTRNSNKQSLNLKSKHMSSQRGGHSNFTPSRTNISIQSDTSNPSGCRPKVLHSPPRQGNTSLLSNASQKDLNSSQNSSRDQSIGIQNIQGELFNTIDPTLRTMEINHLQSSRENICRNQSADFVIPSTQFQDLAQAMPREQSSNNANNNLDGLHTLNPTHSVSMDSLMNTFQEIMRNTQEEFRREFDSLKSTLRSDTGSNFRTQIPRNTVLGNPPNVNQGSLNNQAYTFPPNPNYNLQPLNNSEYNIRLKEWQISYDGNGSVSDFLFKVETLCERTRCPYGHLEANFHVLLSGKAADWFWLFTKQNRNARYPELKRALTKEFGNLESDSDVILKISLRKQNYKETYDDFHSTIISMNSRLRNPIPERSLIDIIKRNVNANLKIIMFSSQPQTLDDLRDIARKGEEVLRDSKIHPMYSSRHINELQIEKTETSDSEILDPQIEALQMPKRSLKSDYSRIMCWNCLILGHSYIYCPEEARNVFCYKCGFKGVTTPNCPNKHQGNLKCNEMDTGLSRSAHQNPVADKKLT